MSADPYSSGALSNEMPTSHGRLQALERANDPVTTEVLAARGVQPSWRCLDLGAGAGGITRWLAERCPDGKVVAADVDIRYLDPSWAPNLEVRRFDVTRDDFPAGHFDLIHARAVMMHLPEREEVLARMAGWLAPGGWMVIGDPDNFVAESSPHQPWRRVVTAFADLMATHGGDMRWSRRGLAPALRAAGLTDLGLTLSGTVVGDGGPGEQFWRAILDQVGDAMIERSLLAGDELALAVAALDDPAFVEVIEFLVTAWGRRPHNL